MRVPAMSWVRRRFGQMADFDNRAVSSSAAVGVVDEGLRAYMLRVSNYMLAGRATTGIACSVSCLLAVATDPAQAVARVPNGMLLTSVGAALLGPFMWVLL